MKRFTRTIPAKKQSRDTVKISTLLKTINRLDLTSLPLAGHRDSIYFPKIKATK